MSQSQTLYDLVRQIDEIVGEPCSYEPKHTIALFTSIIAQILIDRYRLKLREFASQSPPLRQQTPLTKAEKKLLHQLNQTPHYDTPRPIDPTKKVHFNVTDSPPSYSNAGPH